MRPRKDAPILKFKTPATSPYGDYDSISGAPMKLSKKIINFDEINRSSPLRQQTSSQNPQPIANQAEPKKWLPLLSQHTSVSPNLIAIKQRKLAGIIPLLD